MRRRFYLGMCLFIAALLTGTGGCITSAGGELKAIQAPPAANPVAIEYVVGDFRFTLEGGKMVTSNKAGRVLSDAIFKNWLKEHYIESFQYVGQTGFSESSEHRLTLSGSQYGDSSVIAQFFSGLTLFVLPYTVDTKYDIQFLYQNTKTGTECSAEVAASYHTIVELLLFVAAPVATKGMNETFDAMAAHLYDQLHQKCGFGQ